MTRSPVTRPIPITAILLWLLLVLQVQGFVFWAAGPVHAETIDDFVVRTSTTFNGDKVRMEVCVWDVKLDILMNCTVVEGRPDRVDIACLSPPGVPPSLIDKAVCDAVPQVKKWLEQNLWPPRVRVTATSANIKEAANIQSATTATVRHGTILRKIGQEGPWIKVISRSGKIGWIYGELVEPA